VTLYPNSAALYLAGLVKAALAASHLCLYKAISAPLSPSTVIANLTEADYDGYARKALAAWNNPYLDPAGGASIQSGTQQFDFVAVPLTTNVVIGWYLLNAAGDLVAVGNFDNPIAMTQNGDSIPVNVTLNYGAPTG
jgi:hypothetical protein